MSVPQTPQASTLTSISPRATSGTGTSSIRRMPGMGGIELAEKIKQVSPDTQVLILTGQGDMGSAIDGLRHGVFDYLQEAEMDIPRLARAVSAAGERSRLTRENRELLTRLQETNRLLKALHDVAAGIAGEPHLDRGLDRLIPAATSPCPASGR